HRVQPLPGTPDRRASHHLGKYQNSLRTIEELLRNDTPPWRIWRRTSVRRLFFCGNDVDFRLDQILRETLTKKARLMLLAAGMALSVSNSDALAAFDMEAIAVIDLSPVQRA